MGQSHTGSGETTLIAGLTTCARCRVTVEPDDDFCQDCGFHLAAARKSKPNSPGDLKAVLTCLNCGLQHEDSTPFCESCGSRMSDMGVYTTTVRAVRLDPSGRPVASAAVRLAASLHNRTAGGTAEAPGPNIHPAVEARVATTSARWRTYTQPATGGHAGGSGPLWAKPASARKLWPPLPRMSLSGLKKAALLPFLSRSMLDMVTWLILLAFCGSLTWWLVDLERGQLPVPKIGLAQAQAALAAGRLDEAVSNIEKLSVMRDGALSAPEKIVRNQAYYKRAKVRADRGDYKLAVDDLLRISPDFANYAESRLKVAEYSKLADAKGKPAKKESRSKRTAANSTRTGTDAAGATAHESPGTASGQGARPIAEQANQSTDAAADQESSPKISYTDADQRQYHKLLEGYFTSARAATGQTPEWMSADESAGTAAEKNEPPTLQEWLKQGKPDF